MLPKPENFNTEKIKESLLSELYDLEQERQVLKRQNKRFWRVYGLATIGTITGIIFFFISTALALQVLTISILTLAISYPYHGRLLKKREEVFKKKLYPGLIPVLFPGFQFNPAPKYRTSFKIPEEHNALIYIDSIKEGIEGQIKGLKIRIYEAILQRKVTNMGFTRNLPFFEGIYVEVNNLPNHFHPELLYEPKMRKLRNEIEAEWNARLKIHAWEAGRFVLLIYTEKKLLDASLWGWNAPSVYKKFQAFSFYRPIYPCLHYVEVLAEELAKEGKSQK